jgi:hypothetical protein
MVPKHFEDRPPIASEQEALRMIGAKYARDGERDFEGYIHEDATLGPYVSTAKITGWPEQVEWEKNYRLAKEIFDLLKSKGHIRTLNPGNWCISEEGIRHL